MPDVNEMLATLVPALTEAFAERGIAPMPTEWWCGRLTALAEETFADNQLRSIPDYEGNLTSAEEGVRSALSRIGLSLSEQQFAVAWVRLLLQLDEPLLDVSGLRDRLRQVSGGRIHVVDLSAAAPRERRSNARRVEEVTLDTVFRYGINVPSSGEPEAPYFVLDELESLLEVGARLLDIDSDREEPGFRCELSVRQAFGLQWDFTLLDDMLWDEGFQVGDLSERVDELFQQYEDEAEESSK